MNKLILGTLAAAAVLTPLAATAADAQPVRQVTTVRDTPHGRVVTRTVVRRPGFDHRWDRWHHRHGYVVRRVVTRYR